MNITKIEIENLFGIKELKLDGKSIELNGIKGSGKTSVLDAIVYALTNDTSRDKGYIVEKNSNEGRILIKTDTGLNIERKKRPLQSDYKQIKENGKDIPSPESFLKTIFTTMQLNPIEFTLMDVKEQNKILLDLIEFDWDIHWIREQFGEIPENVNYSQNILRVLHDIQKDDGTYFLQRQDLNREIRNKLDAISDIAKDIPEGYQLEKWQTFDIGTEYRKLEQLTIENNKIDRAKLFQESYQNKLTGLEAELQIEIASAQKVIQAERVVLQTTIARLEAELKAANDTLLTMATKLNEKTKLIKANHEIKLEKLKSDVGIADEYAGKEKVDVSVLNSEINEAEVMIKHINEYVRMKSMQDLVDSYQEQSNELTRKIEIARNLPGIILKDANIPVDGLTIVDGVPLIKGLPVSNLSTGEKIELCVDVATAKPLALQLILLDRLGDLDSTSREILYNKCKSKGVQFIATRTTDHNVMEVINL